ncbi:PAS domain-containing protein [Methanosarcina sp. WWM596]|uniref:PAS domain-containing protein n=1 Tax=Methanosarcina sp. WWM596 TaxID=1434103 RepID=UPI0006986E5F|nr:PAS domain-containing protein [Methanosarcina sp. WWM596]
MGDSKSFEDSRKLKREVNEQLIGQLLSDDPNPILRVEKDGTIVYANRAAFPLLEDWGVREKERVPQALRHSILRVLALKSPEYLELTAGKKMYSIKLFPLSKEGCVNIYGLDISRQVEAEEKIRLLQTKLEKFVEKGVPEYINENEKLTEEITERKYIGKVLRNNLHFFEILLNTIPAPVFYKDSEGRYMGCNEIFARKVLGLAKEEIIGKKLFEIYRVPFSEVSREIHEQELKLLRKGGNDTYEKELVCADGIKRDYLVNRATFPDEKGKTNNMVAVMLDVTELKNTGKEIRNSIQFLNTLLNTMPNPTFYKDKDGAFIGFNEVFANQILGLPKEKIIGKTLPSLLPSLSLSIPEELTEYCHRVDLELARTGGNRSQDLELLCADGKIRDFLINRAAFKNEGGKTAGMVGVMQDITQIKRAEETLRNTANFLETLVDGIPSPVFQRDKDGIYLNCNETFANQIMGLLKEQVIGGSFAEFQKKIPKDLAEIYQLYDQELLKQGGSHYYETEVVCADGVKRDFLFHKATYEDSSGNVSGIAGVMLDITPRKAAEKQLWRSEERYRIAAEQTGQIVYDYYIGSKQVDWAGAIKELTGYSPEEFRQVGLEGLGDHIHPEDRERAWEAHERCMRTGDRYLEEYRFRRKDGIYFHVEDSSVYLRDKSGRISRIIGVLKDISERKIAREILEKSEERFRAVAERTGQLVYDYDLKTNRSTWEGAIEKLTGYSYEEFQKFIPEVWIEHLHPEDRQRAVETSKKCLETGENFHKEYRLRRKDGSYFYAEDNGFYIKDKDGKVYRTGGVIKDITERKSAQEKLVESEERFRIVAEQIGQGVYDYDIESDRFSWAGAVEEITGYGSEDPRISTRDLWESLIHPEDRKWAAGYYEQILKEGKNYQQDYRIRRKDGNYIHVKNNGVFLRDEKGRVYRMLGAIKDITERKLAQEKLEKNEERHRLAAEQTGQLVYDYEIESGKTDWAGAIEEITGYGKEEFQKFGKDKWISHIHPEERMRVVESIKRSLETGDRIQEEFRFRKKDGSYFYVENSGTVLKSEKGLPYRVIGVNKDITEKKLAREKLEKSEEKYRIAVEQTGQIVCDLDLEKGNIEWNGAIKELTGYSYEEFQKFTPQIWGKHIHPENREYVLKNIKEYLKRGGRFKQEFRFRRKDGSYFYVENSGIILENERGQTYRILGLTKDITEQKLAREKLEKSEERYRLIAEHIGQILYHDDYKKGITEWSGAIPKITGYSMEEFQKINTSSWLGLIHPKDRKRVNSAHEQCRKEGGNFFEEYRLKKADGSYVTVEDEGVYLKGENGNICKALGVIKDITEKKLTQKKLSESEERFRVATEQTGQIVFEHDHVTNVLTWGGAVTEITGYSIEEFQKFDSKMWFEHVHPKDRERVLVELKKFQKKDSHFRVEYRLRKKDGSHFDVEDSGIYLRNEEGQILKAVGVIKNITPIKLAMEQLRESEERFRIAVEKTGQLVYDYNVVSDRIKWAGAIGDISGYTHEEIHQLTTRELWKKHIHPEDYEKVVTYFRNVFKAGKSYTQEYRLKRKSGDYIYVEDCGTYLRNKEGRVYRMIGVIKNITERKLVTEELRRSEERFRIVAEQTGQLVYDYDILEDKINWTGAIKELTDYSEEEFKNLISLEDWKEFLHPEDRKRTVDSYQKCLEKGEKYREEYRLRRKDRTYLYVENRGVFLKDENGRIYRMLGTNKDITQLKLSIEKVKESEEKYRSFMQNFKGIAFQGDMYFNPFFMHGALEEITGYTEEEFLSGTILWPLLTAPEDRHLIYEDAVKMRTIPNTLIEREYRIRHKNGKLRWICELLQNISDSSGKPVLVQGSVYDITERKEAEESLAKIDEIRKKEIHHRIKNNLQVISSLLELQSDQFSEEKVVEAFRESQNRVVSMAIIHEELYRAGDTETLDFSAYLGKLTSDILRSYMVRQEDVKLKLEVDEVFLGMDTAIPLGIIINELVSNALKHAFPPGRKGEIQITLCRKDISENKNIGKIANNNSKGNLIKRSYLYKLVVSDNGLGFPENIDFRNTDSLGLQLVNILVEQLEGTIKMEKNRGTIFRISFTETR